VSAAYTPLAAPIAAAARRLKPLLPELRNLDYETRLAAHARSLTVRVRVRFRVRVRVRVRVRFS